MSLKLPAKIGIQITVKGVLGQVIIPDFVKDGNCYTNSIYGKSNHNLNIHIVGVIGNVNVELID